MTALTLTEPRRSIVLLLAAVESFWEAVSQSGKRDASTPIERALQRRMARAFRQQGEAFDDAAGKAVDPSVVPAAASVFDAALGRALTTATGEMAEAIEVAAADAMLAGAAALLKDAFVGIAFDLHNPFAVQYLRDYGAKRVTQINETTRQTIKDLVVNGIDNGHSYDEIARQIKARFAEFAVGKPQLHIDSRAHLVAVTEVGNAYEHGTWSAAQSMAAVGLTMEKSWLTSGDDRVSDGCAENEGAGWILLDEPFPSGDDKPLRFPGCRCTVLYRRVGASEDGQKALQNKAD